MKMSNKVYDVLKYIAQIILPALATFYVTIAGFWNFTISKRNIRNNYGNRHIARSLFNDFK